MSAVTVLHLDQLPAIPWKNGGGFTRELGVFPAGTGFDDFLWRASVADVEQNGPFSMLPGIDRVIVLLEGDGMLLHGQGGTHALVEPYEPYVFAGEAPIDALLCGSATRDFNLMTRRGAAHGAVTVWRAARPQAVALDADVVLLFCAAGSVTVQLGDSPARRLGNGDTLQLSNAVTSCRMHARTPDAVVLVASIHLTPPAPVSP